MDMLGNHLQKFFSVLIVFSGFQQYVTISSTFSLVVSSVEKTFFPKKFQTEEQETGIHVPQFLLVALYKQKNPWDKYSISKPGNCTWKSGLTQDLLLE